MSTPHSVDPREIILAKREGFALGRCASQHELDLGDASDGVEVPCELCRRRAAQVFPLPPRVVPRQETFGFSGVGGGIVNRVVDGRLQYQNGNGQWLDSASAFSTREAAARLLALFDAPTTEVPDDGTSL